MSVKMLSRAEQIAQGVQRRRGERALSSRLLAAIGVESAWSREARRVLALADCLQLELDEELLTLSDVRDLQALEVALAARFCTVSAMGL
jgi:hypothetical protein